jgi:AP endonuclease-2
MAVLPSFDSFFSSYSRKPEKGYSGTCIFTRRSLTVPIKAEEGISGFLPLERRPEPSQEELIGGTLGPESIALNMQDIKTIDLEGRTTMIDLGLFVLINVYCPNETNEERLDFKLAFNAMLEARILNLIRLGREVIVLGDLNICRTPLDHCDPVRRMKDSSYAEFGDHPARKWLNEFVAPQTGTMIDLGRHFNPNKKSMFTHWETRINARETNYGTRIDYILSTPGLLKWIKNCDIQPHVIGSDHCPVIADFHESITEEAEDGSGMTTIKYLWDYINPPGRSKDSNAIPPDPPKLAARFYPEFGAEQRLLSTFFKRPASQPTSLTSSSSAGTSSKSSKTRPSSQPSFASMSTLSPAASSSVNALKPSAPLPSTLIVEGQASPSSSQAIIDTGDSIMDSKVKQEEALEGRPSSSTIAPVPSPSIDLTFEDSDGETMQDSTLSSKKAKTKSNDVKMNGKKRKASSGLQSPLPSSSDNGSSGRTITKPKGKNGQQTLATFFKPPTPAPEPARAPAKSRKKPHQSSPVPVQTGKVDKKGKGRASDEDNDGDQDVKPSVLMNTTTLPDDVIITSGDESYDSAAAEDTALNSLKRKASKGVRATTTAENGGSTQNPPRHKKQKSRDVSADSSSSGSDIQDVRPSSIVLVLAGK